MQEFGDRNHREGSIAPIINPKELSEDAQAVLTNYEKVWDKYTGDDPDSKELFIKGLNAGVASALYAVGETGSGHQELGLVAAATGAFILGTTLLDRGRFQVTSTCDVCRSIIEITDHPEIRQAIVDKEGVELKYKGKRGFIEFAYHGLKHGWFKEQ